MIRKIVSKSFMDELKNIYKMINNLLYEYEETDGFTIALNTQEEAKEHYNKRLQNSRKEVDSSFWCCRDAGKRLYGIIDDIMYIIGSDEIPGVPERWLGINPFLKYFDGVYNVINDDFEAFKQIRDGEMCFHFNFIPTLEEYIERNKYMAERYKKYSDCNIKATEIRLLQDELVNTLSIIFAMEFSKYVVS